MRERIFRMQEVGQRSLQDCTDHQILANIIMNMYICTLTRNFTLCCLCLRSNAVFLNFPDNGQRKIAANTKGDNAVPKYKKAYVLLHLTTLFDFVFI